MTILYDSFERLISIGCLNYRTTAKYKSTIVAYSETKLALR